VAFKPPVAAPTGPSSPPATCPFAQLAPAMLASLLLLRHPKLPPTPGPLHMLLSAQNDLPPHGSILAPSCPLSHLVRGASMHPLPQLIKVLTLSMLFLPMSHSFPSAFSGSLKSAGTPVAGLEEMWAVESRLQENQNTPTAFVAGSPSSEEPSMPTLNSC
jgi:hypothetical protein